MAIASKSTDFELSKAPVLSAYLLHDLGNPLGSVSLSFSCHRMMEFLVDKRPNCGL